MEPKGVFPFGGPLRKVQQLDRTPKRVFVLGVYASAVHARWIAPDGSDRIRALAVASEPYIFWRGDRAGDLVAAIKVAPEVGRLVPADERLNGPSGRALDELVLHPLGISREEAWLCDLVPFSCANTRQIAAIEREYAPLVEAHGLPHSSIPPVPRVLADDLRRTSIARELSESEASLVVLLGDQPIRWFLAAFLHRFRRLSDFGDYGRLHEVTIGVLSVVVLPLAHPRQIAKLGSHSQQWHEAHAEWLHKTAPSIRSRI